MNKNLYNDIIDIQKKMLRLMNDVSAFSHETLNLAQPEGSNWLPRCDIFKVDDKLCITVDIAGVDKDSITIKTSPEYLTVSGTRNLTAESDDIFYFTMEIESGDFTRKIFFPEIPLNYETPELIWHNGVLNIVFQLPHKQNRIVEVEIS
jgi:HSP20 family molecular chaperone IbpA